MADSAGVIAKGLRIRGDISGSGHLVVQGEVEGRITLEDGMTIEPSGVVNAEIAANELVIHGRASGTIEAVRRVDVKSSATVLGDVKAPSITVEQGAVLRGRVEMDTGIPEDL